MSEIEPRFSTAWEREDYERQKRGQPALGPFGARDGMSEIELLPCPFCGGEADIHQIGNEHTRSQGFEIRCLTFGCATKKRAMVIHHPLEKAREFAIAAWNRRAALATKDTPS